VPNTRQSIPPTSCSIAARGVAPGRCGIPVQAAECLSLLLTCSFSSGLRLRSRQVVFARRGGAGILRPWRAGPGLPGFGTLAGPGPSVLSATEATGHRDERLSSGFGDCADQKPRPPGKGRRPRSAGVTQPQDLGQVAAGKSFPGTPGRHRRRRTPLMADPPDAVTGPGIWGAGR
jgi:hypothetical protein